jgi:hypothetical protein
VPDDSLDVVAGMGLQRVEGRLVVEAGAIRLVRNKREELQFTNPVTVTRRLLAPLGLNYEINLGRPEHGTEDVVLRVGRHKARGLLRHLREAGVTVGERRSLF